MAERFGRRVPAPPRRDGPLIWAYAATNSVALITRQAVVFRHAADELAKERTLRDNVRNR
ncbi:hypothetical protein [Candidatus Amarobacter glycogenicus]|uniref:hypothetical protein n=1 Tax=Candidatus Amarobacter glycogenicus TaxID=3140699 RepID=UPI002A10DA8E|nr:hypothetical protein [Dehalococcoidia bacterium]